MLLRLFDDEEDRLRFELPLLDLLLDDRLTDPLLDRLFDDRCTELLRDDELLRDRFTEDDDRFLMDPETPSKAALPTARPIDLKNEDVRLEELRLALPVELPTRLRTMALSIRCSSADRLTDRFTLISRRFMEALSLTLTRSSEDRGAMVTARADSLFDRLRFADDPLLRLLLPDDLRFTDPLLLFELRRLTVPLPRLFDEDRFLLTVPRLLLPDRVRFTVPLDRLVLVRDLTVDRLLLRFVEVDLMELADRSLEIVLRFLVT